MVEIDGIKRRNDEIMVLTIHFKTPTEIKRAMNCLSNNTLDGGYTQTGDLTLKITTKHLGILKEKGILD